MGAALHVIYRGAPVIDIWGGMTDQNGRESWQADTLVNIYSSTKGIVAMAIACLIEDDRLALEDKVSDHWPEFGAEEKFDITIADLLAHRSGLFETGLSDPESLLDWQWVTRRLAALAPTWSPGTGYGYHALSWGYLVGEVIRRVSGQMPGEYIRERITAPLNAEMYLGLPETAVGRTATLIGPNRARKPMQSPDRRERELAAKDPVLSPFKHLCSSAFRSAEIPATNGHASARGLTLCYQAFTDGTLVSPQVFSAVTREQTRGETDRVLGGRVRRSCGFILNCADVPMGPSPSGFGHSGTGGSIAFADPDNDLVFAYVMNQLHADGVNRYRKLIDAVYRCVDSTEPLSG